VLLFKEFKIFVKKHKFPLDLHLRKSIHNKNQDNILYRTAINWACEKFIVLLIKKSNLVIGHDMTQAASDSHCGILGLIPSHSTWDMW